MFDQNDNNFETNSILNEFVSKETCFDKMTYVQVLMYALEPNLKQRLTSETAILEKWMANLDLIREIRYRDSIIKDYSGEYFGKDYGYDDPFIYIETTEKKIAKIESYLMMVIGRIISMKRKTELHIGDEA